MVFTMMARPAIPGCVSSALLAYVHSAKKRKTLGVPQVDKRYVYPINSVRAGQAGRDARRGRASCGWSIWCNAGEVNTTTRDSCMVECSPSRDDPSTRTRVELL